MSLLEQSLEEEVQDSYSDIDESMDLYIAFKSKKMIKGVPTIFAFDTKKSREQWYIPDDSVVGGDIEAVKAFLKRCSN